MHIIELKEWLMLKYIAKKATSIMFSNLEKYVYRNIYIQQKKHTKIKLMEDTLTIDYILGHYSLVLIVSGTLCNCLIFLVCTRPNLRKINTFKLFAFLSVSDILTLYHWNLDNLLYIKYGKYFNLVFLWKCRISNYLQYLTLQYSAWILVT
jgi:hypothetical protein